MMRREFGWKPMYEDLEDIIRTAWIWHQNDEKRSKKYFSGFIDPVFGSSSTKADSGRKKYRKPEKPEDPI